MTDTKETKSRNNRSTAYPYIPVGTAVEYSKLLIDSYGKSPFSRENASATMGHESVTGPAAQKISALVHFGLLGKSSNTYHNTELAQRILWSESDENHASDVVTATLHPKLYKKLISDYNGHSLPGKLNNILIQSHGINPNVADKVADNFKKSLEFAGMLQNGVVTSSPSTDITDTETDEDDKPEDPKGTQASKKKKSATVDAPMDGMQSLELPSGLVISYPKDLAFNFAMGEFASELKAIELKASSLITTINPDPAEGVSDFEEDKNE